MFTDVLRNLNIYSNSFFLFLTIFLNIPEEIQEFARNGLSTLV